MKDWNDKSSNMADALKSKGCSRELGEQRTDNLVNSQLKASGFFSIFNFFN